MALATMEPEIQGQIIEIRPSQIYKECRKPFAQNGCNIYVEPDGTIVYERVNDNRRRVKLRFNILPFSAEMLKKVTIDKFVDPETEEVLNDLLGYQRDGIRKHINMIKKGYEEHYLNDFLCFLNSFPFIVEREDGTLAMIDGQQRTSAAKEMNKMMICIVVRGFTKMEERRCFTINNRGLKVNNNLTIDNMCVLPENIHLRSFFERLDSVLPGWRNLKKLSKLMWCNAIQAAKGIPYSAKTKASNVESILKDFPPLVRDHFIFQCLTIMNEANPIEDCIPAGSAKGPDANRDKYWRNHDIFIATIRFIAQVFMKYGNTKEVEKKLIAFLKDYDNFVRKSPWGIPDIRSVRDNHFLTIMIHNWNRVHYGRQTKKNEELRLPFPKMAYPDAIGPLEDEHNMPFKEAEKYAVHMG